MTAFQGFTARASVPMVCSLIADFSPLITLRDLVARSMVRPTITEANHPRLRVRDLCFFSRF